MTHERFEGPAFKYREVESALWGKVNEILDRHGEAHLHGGEFGFHSHDDSRRHEAFDPARLRSAADIAADIMRARTFTASEDECLQAQITYQGTYPPEKRWTFFAGSGGGTRPTLDSAIDGVRWGLIQSGISLRDGAYVVQYCKMHGLWRDLRDGTNSPQPQSYVPFTPMPAEEFAEARRTLSIRWSIDLTAADFGRLLGFGGRDPGLTVLDYEKGKRAVTGPVTLAVRLMLDGARPADLEDRLRR